MDFIDRFTEGARRALALSQDSAKEMGHNYVGSVKSTPRSSRIRTATQSFSRMMASSMCSVPI